MEKAFIKTMAVKTQPYYKCNPVSQADGLV